MNQKTIEETRRELFEAWYVTDCLNVAQITITQQQVSELRGPHGDYRERAALHGKWVGFNAALDAVLIELPPRRDFTEPKEDSKYWEDAGFNHARALTRATIESTNLGIKVK